MAASNLAIVRELGICISIESYSGDSVDHEDTTVL